MPALIPYLSGRSDHLKQMGYFFDYLDIHQKDPEERFEILTQNSKADLTCLLTPFSNTFNVANFLF
jgi:hypothetical protein